VGAQVSATGTAPVTLTGTGAGSGGATDGNDGVRILGDGLTATAAAVTAKDGAISITGTAGPGSNSFAIDVTDGTNFPTPVGGKVATPGTGSIPLTGASLTLGTSTAVIDAGTHTVTLRQKTDVALTVDATQQTGRLSLTDAELARDTAGQLV